MKKQVRAVMLAAAALAAVASAQAAAYNGDLIIGFTAGSGNDFELDLGSASSLGSQQFNLSSQLSGFTLSSVNWGVVGSAQPGGIRTSFTTVASGLLPGQIPSLSRWSAANNAVSSIYSLFATAGPGQSAGPSSLDDNSWNQQTRVGGIATQYHNTYEDPNVTGLTSADLYAVTISTTAAPTLLGTLTLDSSGIVTFTAVPEPTTYGLLAGLGLLVLTVRRQLVSKNA